MKLKEQVAVANALFTEGIDTARALMHHHQSQAKPHTPPCQKSYNKELALRAEQLLEHLMLLAGD